MRIVIDIPEEVFDEIYNKNYYSLKGKEALRVAVRNGTPLPKGHGPLKDADELKKHKYHDNDRFENAVAVAQIDWADTIIPADKESEQK